MTTAVCPTHTDWRSFLDGGDDDARLADHLDGCGRCRETMERLTALPPSPADGATWAAPPARAAGSDRLDNDQLGRLRGLIVTADAPPAADPPTDPGLPTLPGYEVRRELGRGGLAVVFEACHLRLNRLVAVKRMKSWATATPEQLVRFNSDAKFLARLRHPGVVDVYDAGLFDGQPYTVLELIGGESLIDAAAGGPFDPRDAARFVERLARTVHHIHDHGVLHGDLKPGNVLLDRPPARGRRRLRRCRPKVIDFGLAEYRGQDVRLTRHGDVIGTPQYMAPELLAGRNEGLAPSADVYAVGAILYELLAGQPPVVGATRDDVLHALRHHDPAAPSSHRPDAGHAGLDAVCLRCLRRTPAERYPTARALADDLAVVGNSVGRL